MSNSNLLRKASDLLLSASGRYLNIDPRVPVKVGSFGKIDPITAEFIPEGNVYSDEMVREAIPDIMDYPPLEGEISTIEAIRSEQALTWNFGVDPQVSLGGLLEGSVDLKLTVTPGKRAAFLIMENVRTDYLPKDTLIPKLSRVTGLSKMWVVTQVVVCSSYLFGVTLKAEKHLVGKAEANVPVGGGAVSAGGGVGIGLSMNQASGLISKGGAGAGDTSNPKFVTLLHCQVMKPSWRRKISQNYKTGFRGPIPKDDPNIDETNAWMDAPVPWVPLNDDDCAEDDLFDDVL